ncbi:unnamed protein product [Rotaria socialis]|uniref:Uncharacterized protein n=2 Tax=Rotaria socialis TaxID=392032 RepID=A0A820WI29_9BILA|nr:unnamed protein product [Rotaria socialis]CAF4514932.1 unnamed protein product [Rotaria socialis]CAF4566723.1 unnamed protein product [Rotaria socialis]
MQKLSQLVYLMVFLVLVATRCTAQTTANQAGVHGSLHHAIVKRDSCRRCLLACIAAAIPFLAFGYGACASACRISGTC